ncbi:MAG: LCP family protein, partial [Oscillospiraceae bacterium]|nr:LCP family protein [Oscillospiraceae bacterium]
MEQKRRKQKRHSHHGGQDVRASLAVNILIKFAAILLTVMLMILMAANAPIISYTGSDHAITQMSVTKYFKTRQPVKYIEGEINQSSGNKVQVEYREGVDKAFNDGLDLHQTIEGQFTVLFLGFDSVTNGSGKLHDVNYIMQFNLNTASLNILQIPRDTFMPDYTSSTTHKFNSIYSWGDSDATPIQRVVTAVQESFGIPIDAYVTTTCDNIVEIVDIVGGVPINMPFTMVFEADKIIYEGEQTLN